MHCTVLYPMLNVQALVKEMKETLAKMEQVKNAIERHLVGWECCVPKDCCYLIRLICLGDTKQNRWGPWWLGCVLLAALDVCSILCIWLLQCSVHIVNLCVTKILFNLLGVFNRPGVAGAVLQTASSFIHSLINSVNDPFPPNLQGIKNPKPLELRSWNF